MTTNAGAMRELVRVERRVSTMDVNGEESPSWTLVCERRGEILPTDGTEVWTSNERHARVRTTFKMRYPREVTILPQMRVVCRGRVFNILAAVDDRGRGTDLLLMCEELVGEPT